MNNLNPSHLLREARDRAGLTQRELAKRAGTVQSVIARIELGKTDPSTVTLKNILAAAGFELKSELVIKSVEGSHMLDDVSRILALTPEERLEEVKNVSNLLMEAKRA